MNRMKPSHIQGIVPVAALLLYATMATAQTPEFHFLDASSSVTLNANDFADNCDGASVSSTLPTIFSTFQNFAYAGGIGEWGAGGTCIAQDGDVSASSSPVVRLDGDDTSRINIIWRADVIDDADFLGTSAPCYVAKGAATTTAVFRLELGDLINGETYEVHYEWEFNAQSQEEHEDPVAEEDRATGSIKLDLDINQSGPGLLFDAAVDNLALSAPPESRFNFGEGDVQFTAVGATVPITVDMFAKASQWILPDPNDDLAICSLQGTLVLQVTRQGVQLPDPLPLAQSRVIISEVVAGAVGNSNPRYAELTNCGDQVVLFNPGDQLIVFADGMPIPTAVVDLAGLLLIPGQSYVIASTQFAGDLQFLNTYGFNADRYDPGLFGDGNDVYALQSAGADHDVYGVIGVDPVPPPPAAPLPWAYVHSHARRRPNRFPNKGFFDVTNWIIAPQGSLAGANDPESAALAAAQTTPGAHECHNAPALLLGDMNCDGTVNLQDLEPFVLALVNPADYALAFPGCNIQAADMNEDGQINGDDIAAFIAAL